MNRPLTALSLLALLAACDNYEPFFGDPVNEVTAEDLPPGTDNPTANSDIVRYEEQDEIGGGYAQDIDYNANRDTFLVDNLPFDGENVFRRGNAVSDLRSYQVYDARVSVPDFLTGGAVDQIVPYRAIRGVSKKNVDGEARSSFSIVRTGGYGNFGFGGWTYNRKGGVVLPTTGQAQWEGDYAGMRIFNGAGGLEFTEADMSVSLDLDDFNSSGAVKGVIKNRVAYDIDGNVLPAFGEVENGVLGRPLPDIAFVIQEGALTLNDDGELAGDLGNKIVDRFGDVIDFETGKYYAVISGDTTKGDGGEITGVIVINSQDYYIDDLIIQETGGYILPRVGR